MTLVVKYLGWVDKDFGSPMAVSPLLWLPSALTAEWRKFPNLSQLNPGWYLLCHPVYCVKLVRVAICFQLFINLCIFLSRNYRKTLPPVSANVSLLGSMRSNSSTMSTISSSVNSYKY